MMIEIYEGEMCGTCEPLASIPSNPPRGSTGQSLEPEAGPRVCEVVRPHIAKESKGTSNLKSVSSVNIPLLYQALSSPLMNSLPHNVVLNGSAYNLLVCEYG
ncbi:uncharacterized protein PHALS_12403 [Plasmopara halstedii]|uniref:Uncharacterized protein n=1 Tax=Plasmopara halstedii TaxID=4781 RepID=A0A0N7L5Q1_PLAHL|nr:uncharacterized protein PHALS_12403 [Plasmopara halstedii]CEG42099.1 hypothetical protein PHALS_12403 [Plasmopara halstedii]|eukprot:XP_024578468.1 hypothetical protein PHALS_12403 [Plasmopara halstedii]